MSYYFKNRVGYVLSTAINKYCYCSVERTKDSEIFWLIEISKKRVVTTCPNLSIGTIP